MKGFLTTAQTGKRLGVSSARIRRMIIDGLITAEKVGRDNFISESEVKRLENVRRGSGRPKKAAAKE